MHVYAGGRQYIHGHPIAEQQQQQQHIIQFIEDGDNFSPSDSKVD